jgi:hypothetical protein
MHPLLTARRPTGASRRPIGHGGRHASGQCRRRIQARSIVSTSAFPVWFFHPSGPRKPRQAAFRCRRIPFRAISAGFGSVFSRVWLQGDPGQLGMAAGSVGPYLGEDEPCPGRQAPRRPVMPGEGFEQGPQWLWAGSAWRRLAPSCCSQAAGQVTAVGFAQGCRGSGGGSAPRVSYPALDRAAWISTRHPGRGLGASGRRRSLSTAARVPVDAPRLPGCQCSGWFDRHRSTRSL